MFWIKNIVLNNFRCYKLFSTSFSEKINIIIGKNAVGKTSLVEGINVLGCCKSHKTNSDSILIKKGEEFYRLECTINEFDNTDNELKVISTKSGKKVSINNKQYKNLSDYIGYFKVVMFCPEDLSLVKGDPADKRKFLDLNIGQMDKEYLRSLIRYKTILKERNEFLKQIENNNNYDKVLLNTYTEALIREAKVIINKRKEFVSYINTYFNTNVNAISCGKEIAEIVYKPNVNVDNLLITFEKKVNLDVISQTTNTGPHRDSFEIYIDGENSADVASQGQQRTLALSLKLALAEMIKEKTDRIVIILDDVFGELDIDRQNQILELINYDCQIFITTTSVDNLTKEIINSSKIIEIEKDGGIHE